MMAALISLDEGMTAIRWVLDFEYWPNLLLGAGLVTMGYLFGQRAGVKIIEKKKDHSWAGIILLKIII